jgi:hypothetical protein
MGEIVTLDADQRRLGYRLKLRDLQMPPSR